MNYKEVLHIHLHRYVQALGSLGELRLGSSIDFVAVQNSPCTCALTLIFIYSLDILEKYRIKREKNKTKKDSAATENKQKSWWCQTSRKCLTYSYERKTSTVPPCVISW